MCESRKIEKNQRANNLFVKNDLSLTAIDFPSNESLFAFSPQGEKPSTPIEVPTRKVQTVTDKPKHISLKKISSEICAKNVININHLPTSEFQQFTPCSCGFYLNFANSNGY